MMNFIKALRATANNDSEDFAYTEISLHYENYSKLELSRIIKEMLYAISSYDDRKDILLDTSEGLGEIYDIYDV